MARREPCILPTVDTTVKALPDGRCLGGKSSAAYHAHDRTRVSRGQTPSEQSSDVMDIIKCRSEAQRIRTAKDRLMTGLMVRSSFKAGRETGTAERSRLFRLFDVSITTVGHSDDGSKNVFA